MGTIGAVSLCKRQELCRSQKGGRGGQRQEKRDFGRCGGVCRSSDRGLLLCG